MQKVKPHTENPKGVQSAGVWGDQESQPPEAGVWWTTGPWRLESQKESVLGGTVWALWEVENSVPGQGRHKGGSDLKTQWKN